MAISRRRLRERNTNTNTNRQRPRSLMQLLFCSINWNLSVLKRQVQNFGRRSSFPSQPLWYSSVETVSTNFIQSFKFQHNQLILCQQKSAGMALCFSRKPLVQVASVHHCSSLIPTAASASTLLLRHQSRRGQTRAQWPYEARKAFQSGPPYLKKL